MSLSLQEILLVLSTMAAATMLVGTLFNLFTAPRLEKAPPPRTSLRVSLLIPARNEEANLRILMPLLSRLDFPGLEILILDDDSNDGTAVVAAYPGSPARLIRGQPLPLGWLGKNWACAQLASQAQGEVLIFCDADVRVGPGAIPSTLGMMQAQNLDALTCIPYQILGTWAEKAIIPVLLFMPALGYIPIDWIRRIPIPFLSVGCGQWFAFTREAYDCLGGHASVRNEIVEDMMLGRRVKASGMVLGAAIATRHLSVRMYTDFRSVWQGFGKNMAFLTGTGWLKPPAVLAFSVTCNVLPWLMPLLGFRLWVLPLSIWIACRLLCASIFKEPLLAWLWSPLGTLLVPLIAIRSWWGYRRGSVQWKGRNLTAAFTKPSEG